MELLNLIGDLSSFATLQSWIKEQISKNKNSVNEKNLNNLSEIFKENKLKNIKETYEGEKLDIFITKHADLFKKNEKSYKFSVEERNKVINEFFKVNPGLRYEKDDIENILNMYLDTLEENISRNLNYDTKFIIDSVDNSNRSITKKLEEINDKFKVKNIYQDSLYSKELISICKGLNSLFIKNLNIVMITREFDENYLNAESLSDVIMRLEKFLKCFNMKDFKEKYKAEGGNTIETLFKMVLTIASDFCIELNEYYQKVIIPTLTCIDNYDEKSKEYYISIGALGLFNDNSDENVFKKIMDNIINFFDKLGKVLEEIWKCRDYKKLDDNVTADMHRSIYNHIKYKLDDKKRLLVKTIYDKGKILDTDLANIFSCSVKEIRYILYDLTETLIGYNYFDNKSTTVYIDSAYKKTIKLYYNEIFKENKNEG